MDPGHDSEVKIDMAVPGMVDQELMLEFGMLGLFVGEVRDSVQADLDKIGQDLKSEVDKTDQGLKQASDMVDLDMMLDIVDLIDGEDQVLVTHLRLMQN